MRDGHWLPELPRLSTASLSLLEVACHKEVKIGVSCKMVDNMKEITGPTCKMQTKRPPLGKMAMSFSHESQWNYIFIVYRYDIYIYIYIYIYRRKYNHNYISTAHSFFTATNGSLSCKGSQRDLPCHIPAAQDKSRGRDTPVGWESLRTETSNHVLTVKHSSFLFHCNKWKSFLQGITKRSTLPPSSIQSQFPTLPKLIYVLC